MRNETSILLPSAAVDLFLKDAATIAAAKSLSEDWRFARVNVRVHEGDVETAQRHYAASNPSPDMVMLETDTTDDGFIAQLGALSAQCEEGTSAVVIGPVNDVNLYRSLTSMGVSDYLVRPVPVDTLSEVIAKALIEKIGAAGSRLIAFIGAKGGVGTSALAQAAAWGAAQTLGQKTFLFDAAGGHSSLGVGLGFEPASGTGDVIRAISAKDMDSFRRLLFHPHEKLSVLGTGAENILSDIVAAPQGYEDILNTAMSNYPVVVADLSGASTPVQKMILTRAHQVVLVATPTLAALRTARSMMQEIKSIAGGKDHAIDFIVNMAGFASGKEVGKADISAAMEMTPSAYIDFDPKLFIGAENEGKQIGAIKAGEPVMHAIMPILRKVTGVATESAAGQSLLEKLKLKRS